MYAFRPLFNSGLSNFMNRASKSNIKLGFLFLQQDYFYNNQNILKLLVMRFLYIRGVGERRRRHVIEIVKKVIDIR